MCDVLYGSLNISETLVAGHGSSICGKLRTLLARARWLMVFLSQGARFREMQAVVGAVLLVCILVIVIAPQVDLPPTALRAHAISSLLIQLAALALVITLPIRANRSRLDFVSLCETPSPPLLLRLSIICVRLC